MNVSHELMTALTLIALAVFLAHMRYVVKYRFTYRLVWAAALAFAFGCGFLIA